MHNNAIVNSLFHYTRNLFIYQDQNIFKKYLKISRIRKKQNKKNIVGKKPSATKNMYYYVPFSAKFKILNLSAGISNATIINRIKSNKQDY